MPGRNGRCENGGNVDASARVEESQDERTRATNESSPEDGSTTANAITHGSEVENGDEGEIGREQTDLEDSRDSQSGARDRAGVRDLPQFSELASPTFRWGDVDGETFAHSVECCYEETVHWRRNLFKIPSGKAGKSFVHELTKLFRAYADGSALESIALKAAMVLPALMLQKPHQKSKAKDHSSHLDRRLRMWARGDINALMLECRTIQNQLGTRSNSRGSASEARTFAKLMMEGKVRAALRTITATDNGGVLSLTKEVRETLEKKHPPKQPPTPSAIIEPDTPFKEPHFILFEKIDGHMIRETALKTDGAAGPSGLDAAAWKRLCSSFSSFSADLCDAMASVAKRICTSYVDPSGLTAFTACRLIALDKCPGIRPIGIGETARRIISRAILTILKDEIQAAAGPLQLCAGQEAGCEAAIHAMQEVFETPEVEAAIIVDASNAFNSLNRQNALRNIQHLCPSLATVLINTYREDVQLHIDGETLLSQEGTTQGDPLAMAMYAIGILPLIHRLKGESVKQVWYADDATAGAQLAQLRDWWDRLVEHGPDYGYYPNASKTWIVVKEDKVDAAVAAFQGTEVNITIEGKRQLGAALGTRSFVEEYVHQKVAAWVQEIERLSSIAITQPHAAYAAFTHGLMNKWMFLARTIGGISDHFQPLEEAIRHRFLPSLTGQKALSDAERELMALPVRLGGLGITNPATQTDHQYSTSQRVTAPLAALILQQSPTCPTEVKDMQRKAKSEARSIRRQQEALSAAELMGKLPNNLQRALKVSSEKGASSWLSALPMTEHGFALHKGAFRDALCLRYGWRPSNLPTNCVCGKPFSVEHALSCACGGLPSIRHNELRDITAELLTEVCHNVGTEPALQSLSQEQLKHRTANREDGARLDVVAESFWGRDRQRAFFDVRVFNPIAQSHRNTPLAQCYRQNEQEKKRAYEERVREVEHGTFSPLVFSTSGGMGPIATVVYRRIASLIAEKQQQPYSRTLFWLRCKLSFSLLRSAIMCLRGARSSLHHPARPSKIGEPIDLTCSEGRIPLQD